MQKVRLSVEELLAALKKHQQRLPKLRRQEAKLLKQLSKVQTEIRLLGEPVVSAKSSSGMASRKVAGAKRPKNSMNLADAIVAVLSKDATLNVGQIEKAVRANGYKSTSKTFGTIIYQTLARDRRIKRASRGLYQLK